MVTPQLPASGRMRQFPVRNGSGWRRDWSRPPSGIGSLAFQDVIGKTIPKPKRGQLLALHATAGGIFTLAVGLVLRGHARCGLLRAGSGTTA